MNRIALTVAVVTASLAIAGPAIIEQMDTTTVVPPGARIRNDRRGYLHMELRSE